MRVPHSFVCCIFVLLLFICNSVTTGKVKRERKWEGILVFQDDFDGYELKRDYWTVENWCYGKGKGDTNLECFVESDDNVSLSNGTLVIKAIHKPHLDKRLYGKSKNFTSGWIRTRGPGFSYGTFVVSARMPKGNFLLPSVSLTPAYYGNSQHFCKHEEIDIVLAKGHKSSNLLFSASFGRNWNSVLTREMEKAFRGIDFSESFHEFATVWKPFRIEWFVDGKFVHRVPTYFYTDWILEDGSNMPCSKDQSLFKQPLQLNLALSVGGKMFNNKNPLQNKRFETHIFPKPTLEIDWVKVYQFA